MRTLEIVNVCGDVYLDDNSFEELVRLFSFYLIIAADRLSRCYKWRLR